jgi:predicted ferric reductase
MNPRNEISQAGFVSDETADQFDDMPLVPFRTFFLIMLAAVGGAVAAWFVLPFWIAGMSGSMQGGAPQAFWFLSRSSALVAYFLLWISMALGLMITNKMARMWPGGPFAFDLHQYATLLGLAFATFHALILMGDHYINYSLVSVLVPFASGEYRPLWVGLGQMGIYLMALVTFSFYVRRRITPRVWRLVHYLSFAVFLLVMVHGIFSGTDSQALAVRGLYWFTGGSILFLFVYRLLVTVIRPRPATARRPA